MNESEVFLDRLGCLFNRDGRGHDYVYAAFFGKLVHLAEEHIKVLRDCKSVFPTETPYLAIMVLHGEIPGSGYVVALHADMYVKLIICAQPAQQIFQAGFVGLECSDGKVVVLVGICALIKFISIEFAYAGN